MEIIWIVMEVNTVFGKFKPHVFKTKKLANKMFVNFQNEEKKLFPNMKFTAFNEPVQAEIFCEVPKGWDNTKTPLSKDEQQQLIKDVVSGKHR